MLFMLDASYLEYKKFIYDANCIIYYCFRTELQSRNGEKVIIDSPFYTDITRELTQFLINKGKIICTVLAVYEEITKEVLSLTVKERISNEELRQKLGLRRGEKFPEDIEYKINKNLIKKIKKIKYENWFQVDEKYKPDIKHIREIRDFYKTKKDKLGRKGIPSSNDITLLLYSRDITSPLITNDGHMCDFKEDLIKKGYVHKIIPLKECAKYKESQDSR